jgi:vacuole morphology and inheritance protein 14
MTDLTEIQNALPSLKSLNDKLYEKRKLAAIEIERWVRETWASRNVTAIRILLAHLVNDYISSAFPNSRNGGLIGLAAIAIALGPDVSGFLNELIFPVLPAFSDQDSRVR